MGAVKKKAGVGSGERERRRKKYRSAGV